MSGGHFDYAYARVHQFADELEQELREPREGFDYGPSTVQELQGIVNRARELALLMKEVEWLFSGDTSEETFLDEIKAI